MLNSPIDYSLLAAFSAALILGFSKSGFKGLGFLIVTLMALAYGTKASTGILLPLLISADIMAIIYYRKDVDWKTLFKLFPPMAIGVLLATAVGDQISLAVFKKSMAAIIVFSGIMMLFLYRLKEEHIPKGRWFALLMGFGAGFTSMLGNLAGAFSNFYFLAMRFEKRIFIGTSAWLFFFINLFKLPFHIWVWKTISTETLFGNLKLIPFVIIGFAIGTTLLKKISNELFLKYVIIMTILGSILIFFR